MVVFITRLTCIVVIFLFWIERSFPQNTVVTIKAGEDVSILNEHIYKYRGFTPGKVYFNDGTVARSKMNFNLWLETILFIDEKGDTLALANENTVKYLTMGTDTFFVHEGYLQLISNYGNIKLATRQKIKFLDEKNIGAYGLSTSTHTIDNYNTLRAYNTYTLKVNKDLVYSKEKKYYFSKGNDDFVTVNKKNVLKMFPHKKKLTEDYLKEHEIAWDSEHDLKNLFGYLVVN